MAEPRRRHTVPMLGCDGFLLASDHMMRRGGQGAHISQTVLELAGPPDLERLRAAWRSFVHDHPIVVARRGRSWRTGLPVWRVPALPADYEPTPIGLWREAGTGGDAAATTQEVESFEALCQSLRDQRDDAPHRRFNLRLDLLARVDGSHALITTWAHLLLDGKGVELFLNELGRRCRGEEQTGASASPPPPAVTPERPSTVRDKVQRSRAFVEHFYQLAATRFRSLGGPRPVPGRMSCRVVTLDAHTTARVNDRAARLTNQLINTPFFLAAAAYAHGRVFELRGHEGGPQVITLPIQTRPKGGRGPIFQNYVTILFFRLSSEALGSVEAATRAVQGQFAKMIRNRLDTSFSMMLDLMRWMPPRLYALFLRKQMHGEITSFFHSYTGPFALGGSDMAGARVKDAWHVPVISTPPGTGLFVGEYDGRLTLSMSWRDGALAPAEQDLLLASFITGLVGEPVASERLTTNLQA